MNDGRRQLPKLPMQLLQPGAAARLTTAIARHITRVMLTPSTTDGRGGWLRGAIRGAVADDANGTLPHDPRAAGRDARIVAAGATGPDG
ncbi:MAG: hypothetical protein ACKOC8_06185 [Pirellulales bacterium]